MVAPRLKQGGKKVVTVEQVVPLGSPVSTKNLLFRTVRVVLFALNSHVLLDLFVPSITIESHKPLTKLSEFVVRHNPKN